MTIHLRCVAVEQTGSDLLLTIEMRLLPADLTPFRTFVMSERSDLKLADLRGFVEARARAEWKAKLDADAVAANLVTKSAALVGRELFVEV